MLTAEAGPVSRFIRPLREAFGMVLGKRTSFGHAFWPIWASLVALQDRKINKKHLGQESQRSKIEPGRPSAAKITHFENVARKKRCVLYFTHCRAREPTILREEKRARIL